MSLQLILFDKLFRVLLKRRFSREPDILGLRRLTERLARHERPAPRGVRLAHVKLGGVACEEVHPLDAERVPRRAVLYLHGGAFVSGSPVNHRPITRRLAMGLGCTVYALDYRLAPEHPFPAAVEDCASAYQALLARGLLPKHLAVAGDSAGGNLALALALQLKTLALPQPGALVCLSAPTDMTAPFPSRTENAALDAMFDPKMFPTVAEHYCPGEDLTNPLLSPLRGDVTGLPPTLLLCSAIELLRDDSVEMAAKMKRAGVEAVLEVWPRVFHAWPVLADYVPESRRAVARIIGFLDAKL